jgi:hypothetical protein
MLMTVKWRLARYFEIISDTFYLGIDVHFTSESHI